jgi:predicted aspartyl protease
MYVSKKSSITTPFTSTCARGKAKEEALVDSGATNNFMDQRMAQRLGIGTRKLEEPRRVFNVDGMENQAGLLTEYCTL